MQITGFGFDRTIFASSFLMTLLPLVGVKEWVPMNFLQPAYPDYTLYPLIIEAVALFALTFWRVVIVGSKTTFIS